MSLWRKTKLIEGDTFWTTFALSNEKSENKKWNWIKVADLYESKRFDGWFRTYWKVHSITFTLNLTIAHDLELRGIDLLHEMYVDNTKWHLSFQYALNQILHKMHKCAAFNYPTLRHSLIERQFETFWLESVTRGKLWCQQSLNLSHSWPNKQYNCSSILCYVFPHSRNNSGLSYDSFGQFPHVE